MAHARYKTFVDATYNHVFALLMDKVENPRKYVGTILHSTILERGESHVIRSMYEPRPLNLTIREKITHGNTQDGAFFTYEHIGNARYSGTVTNLLTRIPGRDDAVELEYIMDWTPHGGQPDPMTDDAAATAMRNAVIQLKRLAERKLDVPDWVTAFYAAVDARQPEAMGPLLAERCKFRVANNPVVTGREQVVQANREVLGHFASIAHDIVEVQTSAGRTYVESYVAYGMPDGSNYLLPVMTVFEREADKIAEVVIYADLSPLHHGWPVPPGAA